MIFYSILAGEFTDAVTKFGASNYHDTSVDCYVLQVAIFVM